ncbi:MAG TPA: serine/threonine-protein kinase [Chthoniobacterales bacterium]|nr:serine/threonine-protein kinase [Chthoniobacterales bacterium]
MDPRTPEEEKPAFGEPMGGVVAGRQLFQRFTLQKVLGRGAMSVVWLAHDDRLERLVALKLVPESDIFDPAACEDLKRETHRSLLLTHANIVRIFDFIADEGIAAISMEYVDGTTLSDARREKRSKCFGIPELVPWVTSLCDALAYAHESAGLIHRDLRPANILVDSRGKLKITNFGIASSLRNSMSRVSGQTSPGTLNYMSPQQMLGEEPSPSDDIYALGVTLYEMLSSKPPFYSGDVASQVRETIAPPVTQRRVTLGIAGEPIPKRWEETIAACLAKDPGQRPQSAAEVAERLRLGGTVRLTTAREIAKPVFDRYLKLGALAAGLAALAAAAVISSRSNSPVSRPNAGPPFKPETPTGYALESAVKRVPASRIAEPPPGLAPMTAPQNATLQLATTPAGVSFAIYPGVVAGKTAPAAAPLRRGATPESVADLPPGPYTIFFHNEGWPGDRAEIAVQPGETLPVEYTFPHGSATITSTPDGAEIFAGEKLLGVTPLTVDLPLGKQELVARHPDFPKKTETVTIESETPATVAFQLRPRSRSSGKAKEPPSAWDKFSNSLKKVFSSKPPPKKKRNPVTLPSPAR